jgi:hypothetical protein
MATEHIESLNNFFNELTKIAINKKKDGEKGHEDLLTVANNASFLLYYIDKLQQEKGELICLAEMCSKVPQLDVDSDMQLISLRAEGKRALAIAEQSDLGYISYKPRRNAIIIEHVEEVEEDQHEWIFSVECRDRDLESLLNSSALRIMELTKMEIENANKS